MNVVYKSGNYEVYQSEGSSRYNVRKFKKFIRGYKTFEEAKFYVDNANSKPIKRLV